MLLRVIFTGLASVVVENGMARSWSNHHFDRLAVGHRAVAVRDAIEGDGAVEHATGVTHAANGT
jgi:hypothetical protein